MITGSGRGFSGSASVSPIVTSSRPATAMISPGPASSADDPVERLGDVELRHRGPSRSSRRPGTRRSAGRRGSSLADAAERQAADVGRGVEVGHVRLQRVPQGRRSVPGIRSSIRSSKGDEVGPLDSLLERRPTRFGVGVDDREVDLLGVGVEVDEQLVDLVDDLGDAGVGAVDLVDDEDHRQLSPPAPCAARSGSAAAAPRRRRPAAAPRRPSSGRARPRRRSRRGRACRRC